MVLPFFEIALQQPMWRLPHVAAGTNAICVDKWTKAGIENMSGFPQRESGLPKC
jgi:hypothetical protein